MNWDNRFLQMTELVASWSKDPSTQVGSVIVRPDKTVASVGFNGFPKGMRDDRHLYECREEKYSRIIHAEANAILNAHGPVDGCTCYVNRPPCGSCGLLLIQSGIRRVVCRLPLDEDFLSRWRDNLLRTRRILEEVGIEYVEVLDVG